MKKKIPVSPLMPSGIPALRTPLKLIIPIWSVFLVFGLSIFFIFIPIFKSNLIEQKKAMIQTLTDSAASLLAEYQRRVESGELSLEEAQAVAMNLVRHLRYGAEGKDYFWIIDPHPFMLMHPYRPDLEGRDLTLFRDAGGNYPFIAMVSQVMKNQGGYVNYYWQWKDAPHKIVPKISYVRGFTPWGWIIGTGIYIEDVLMEIQTVLQNLTRIFWGLLLFVLALSAYITRQAFKIRAKKARFETALRKEKETLAMILESTPHGIALVDSDGRYRYVNPYFTAITGYTLADIPTKTVWFEKAYPDEAYRKKAMTTWDGDSGRGGTAEFREFRIQCKNRAFKHIEFRTSFLENQRISVLTDVTSRKESEKVQRDKDRLEGVLEVSGAVCHEMNQPLMSVEGYVDLILMDLPDDDPAVKKIQKIKIQLARMTDITKKLMEISRFRATDDLNVNILDLAVPARLEQFDMKED